MLAKLKPFNRVVHLAIPQLLCSNAPCLCDRLCTWQHCAWWDGARPSPLLPISSGASGEGQGLAASLMGLTVRAGMAWSDTTHVCLAHHMTCVLRVCDMLCPLLLWCRSCVLQLKADRRCEWARTVHVQASRASGSHTVLPAVWCCVRSMRGDSCTHSLAHNPCVPVCVLCSCARN